MGKVLTALNAELSTVAIAIRTLVIDKKQVTLAVFRQLGEESIVGEGFFLKGVPWGHVRYFWDENKTLLKECPDKVIHLIWQSGSNLRRCIVKREWRDAKEVLEAEKNLMKDELQKHKYSYVGDVKRQFYSRQVWNFSERVSWNDSLSSEDNWRLRINTAEKEYAEYQQMREKYRVCVAPLFDVEQLFIAI